MSGAIRVAVDIGGTFTDIVAFDEANGGFAHEAGFDERFFGGQR